MAFKQSKHIFQGMSRDLSEDKQKGIYYIDAHNIRITAREDTTLLSVTNEKGNKDLNITNLGKYVGHAVLNNYLVLFTTSHSSDDTSVIWRIDMTDPDNPLVVTLYEGNLGFSPDYPIETLVDYETEEVQKVYWISDNSQPRVINIVSDSIKQGVDTQFDFIPEVFPNNHDDLDIKVDKLINSSGTFKSGTIQYFVSYYNKFGQESNIVWQSPLLYISPENRGGNVSETVGNAFRFTIHDFATTFDFIRIYAVQHTSEDTDLIGRRIIDLSISDLVESQVFIDNGILGESFNPAELYYKGGVPTIVGTMAAKDQTLFLGNIKLESTNVADEIKSALRNPEIVNIQFESITAFPAEDAEGKYYDYYNQLNENGRSNESDRPVSHSIKSFKYLETYRFGLQFQDKYGKWSEPVFIGDYQNTVAPKVAMASSTIKLPAAYTILNSELLTALREDYVKVRPLVVLPNENERECIAQGVLCPTVYNVQDRLDNSPFAQPSWFFRPYWPISWPYTWNQYSDDNKGADYGTLLPYAHNGLILGGLSLKGEIEKSYSIQGYYTGYFNGGHHLLVADGGTLSSSHFPNYASYYIPNSPLDKVINNITNYQDLYYIDQSLITLNSPDIDFDEVFPSEDLQFRVIGALNITGCYGSMSLETEYSPNNFWGTINSTYKDTGFTALGFYKKDIAYRNYTEGCRVLGNGPYWLDVPYIFRFPQTEYKPDSKAQEFIVYPWQSAGSLGGGSFDTINFTDPPTTPPQNGTLERKIISNIRYSPETVYLNQPLDYDTTDIQFISETDGPAISAKISEDMHYNNSDIVYYSSIDKLSSVPTHNIEEAPDSMENYNFDIIVANREFIITDKPTNQITAYNLLRRKYEGEGENSALDVAKFVTYKKYTATHITYKSSPHALVVLKPKNASTINILPSINGYGSIPEYCSDPQDATVSNVAGDYNLINKTVSNNSTLYECVTKSFWQTEAPDDTYYVEQQNATLNFETQTTGGILLIGEIYRPLVPNKFGGTSEDAIQQNVWLPAGPSINLDSLGSTTPIRWIEGDTYFQRYDCLKTYPYSNESTNNIVEILSFMCETRINIAGRYDKNRGLLDNTFITNENFNLINKGYTQKNNFFSYKILDSRFKLKQFKNQLTWTRVKSAAALVDNWTNITLQNTLDLDGDKGELVSLNRYSNDIIALQPKGISQIIYNPNVQISTNSGLPIELANSGRVQGKRYLYEGVGCQNKWSVCDEVYGNLYFVDNYARSIFRLSNEGLVSLTDIKGFKEWMHNNNTLSTWLPYSSDYDSNAFRVFYDKGFKDIYFVNGNTCLVYSTLLDQFVSFMDYQMTDAMFNIGDNFYASYNNALYQQFAGDYNNIYGNTVDYDITFIDNPIPEMNKIYTNLEYRSDTYSNDELQHDETFDTVRVFNEYQDTGNVNIHTVLDRPYLSSLQKKFRVWRVQIPRDMSNGINRINNTWTKVTLKKTNPDKEKTVLHDAMIGYYV